MKFEHFTGLIAATHTPFSADGSLNLGAVERQAEHLARNSVRTVFIGGSTGECHSMSLEERRQLTQRWVEVARGTRQSVIIHVGSNCLGDARELTRHAARLGVAAVSAMAPSYFKPASAATLLSCCAEIASAAPNVPFYFYDIPAMTGVNVSMPAFLDGARERIPNLAGIKFTHTDLAAYQLCLNADGGSFDILWGSDEHLLAGLVFGGKGAVGSTYNFAAPIYNRLLKHFADGDLAAAQREQLRSVQFVKTLYSYGYMGACKAVLGRLGVDVGPARLPNGNPAPEQAKQLCKDLDALGFFEWIGN